MMVIAFTGIVRAQAKLKQIATALNLLTLLFRRIDRKLQQFESNMIVTFTMPQTFIRTQNVTVAAIAAIVVSIVQSIAAHKPPFPIP
jgi:hypothetical protein